MFQKPAKTVHKNTPICQFISKPVCSKLQPNLSQFNYRKKTEQRPNTTKSFYIHRSNIQVGRRLVPIPLLQWLTTICQVMNLMEWAALQSELWPLVHTQTKDPIFSHAPWKLLGSHTSPIRPRQPFPLRGGMQLHCIPLASSQYSCTASGPQLSPNITRSMQGTSHSQRSSRWWMYHTEEGSCYYVWKYVTLYN